MYLWSWERNKMDKMEFKTRGEIASLVPHKGKMLLMDRIKLLIQNSQGLSSLLCIYLLF